jgi:hypothetical protein
MTINFPDLTPLERLHVFDGLMMNAQRWGQNDHYQRQRQNLQFQSLHQAGMVWGLGVRSLDPSQLPDSIESEFRTRRWIEVQPGAAIDRFGNPIIVDAVSKDNRIERCFRIEPQPRPGERLLVHVALSFEERYQDSPQDGVWREGFSFEQIVHPADDASFELPSHCLELCRILLEGEVSLQNPVEPLSPQANQIDLRFRVKAQPKAKAILKLAQLIPTEVQTFAELNVIETLNRTNLNLRSLLAAVQPLSSYLQGDSDVPRLNFNQNCSEFDLLLVQENEALGNGLRSEAVQNAIASGSVLLIENVPDQQAMKERLNQIFALKKNEWQSWQELPMQHPLRNSPFTFGALPDANLEIWINKTVILCNPSISARCGIAQDRTLSRDILRGMQELGINLLHYGWQSRSYHKLLRSVY